MTPKARWGKAAASTLVSGFTHPQIFLLGTLPLGAQPPCSKRSKTHGATVTADTPGTDKLSSLTAAGVSLLGCPAQLSFRMTAAQPAPAGNHASSAQASPSRTSGSKWFCTAAYVGGICSITIENLVLGGGMLPKQNVKHVTLVLRRDARPEFESPWWGCC